MALRGLIRQVPVWLVPGEDRDAGHWLSLDLFPGQRAAGSAASSKTIAESR
jgi:hypothetical protein